MSSNANKTVTLTVDVQAKLNDLQGQVKKMQEMLGGLKMPDSIAQSTTKSINDLFEKIKNLQGYTEGNKLKLIDEKKVQSGFNGIQKDFKQLVNTLNKHGAKIKLGDNKVIDALEKGIKEYNDALDETRRKLRDQSDLYAEARKNQKNLQEDLKQYNQTRQKDVDALKDKEEELTKLQEKRQQALKKYTDNGHSEKAGENYLRGDEEFQQLKKDIEQTEQAVNSLRENLNNTKQAFLDGQKKIKTSIEEATTEVNNQRAEVNKLEDSFKELSGAELEKLKEKLSEIGFDTTNITSIDDLKDKLKQLNEQDFGKIKEFLANFGVEVQKNTKEVEGMSDAVYKDTEAFKELDSTLEAFKKKATYFFGMTNAVNLLRRAVRSAFETVKDLDKVMTETAVVTDFSVGDMWAQLPEYTKRANELGVSIHDAYEAATLYYQQGLKTNEVIAVSNETLKMARIAGLGAAEATDRMTNALRGFNMEINEESAQRVNDVYSKLAAITAADTDEISTAMTKVASLAHNANMEFETTSAFLSQMIETTRESAETAGTALKTVIARFSEVKKLYSQGDLMGTDEEGEEIDVNKVSQALRSAGINLNEYLSGAKGLDDIFIELAGKWQKLDMVQQRYIATMAAGSRQQSRFIAMMSDYDRTMQLVTAANTSAGASQKQFEKTLDSLQSKLAQLKNSWDTFLMGIADDTLIKFVIDALTKLIDAINRVFEVTDKIPVGGSLARIMAIVGALKLGKAIIDRSIVSLGFFTGITKKQAEAELEVATATGAANSQMLASDQLYQKGIFSLLAYLKGLNGVSDAKKTEALMDVLTAKSKNKNIIATTALNSAEKAEDLTLKQLTTTIYATIAAYALLAAGVVALAISIKKLADAFADDAEEKRLERLTEATEAASNAAEEAASQYNNLKDALSGLSDKYDTIETLTRGTQEWRDAVREVNSEVLELMATYDEAEVVNENGVLRITNTEAVKNAASQKYNNAQVAQIGLQRETATAEADILFKRVKSELSDTFSNDWNVSTEDFSKLLQEVKNGKYSGSEERIRKELENSYGDQIDITDSLVQSLKEYSQALNEQTSKFNTYNQALAATAVSEANIVKGTEDAVQNFLSVDRMDTAYINAYNSMGFSGGFSGKVVDTFIKGELLKELGYRNEDEYKEKTGKELDAEGARIQLAQIKAQKQATKSAELFSRTLEKLPDYVQKMYSRADGLGLTQANATQAANGFSFDNYRNASTDEERKAEAQKLIDAADDVWKTLSKEEKEAFGSIEDFRKEYALSVIHTLDAFDDVEKSFNDLGISAEVFSRKVTAGTLKDFSNNLEQIYKASGTAGVKEIESQIEQIVAPMGDEEAERFMSALNSIDWSSADSIDTLKDALDEFDVSLSEDEIDKLTASMIELGAAARNINLEKVIEQLEKIGTLSSKIRTGEQGYTGWSKEDMQSAVEVGIDRSEFHLSSDGTYTYTGSDLQDVASALESSMDKIAGVEKYEAQIRNAEVFNKLDKVADQNNLDELRDFLFKYSEEATDVSRDVLYDNYWNKEELQNLYNYISLNADNIAKNTAALDEARLLQQQILDSGKSILENAQANNEGAVIAQARQYGVSDQAMDLYNGNIIDLKELANIGAVDKEASDRGFDVEQVNRYAQELKKVQKNLSQVQSYQVALSNTRTNKGMEDLVNSYEDWTKLIGEDGKLLQDLDSDSEQVLNDMKKGVNNLLDTSKDLPDTFYDSADNLALVKKAVEEGGEALTELRLAAADSIIPTVDSGPAKDSIDELRDYILNETPNMHVGADMDISLIEEAYQQMIASGKYTAETIQAYFDALGVDLEVEYETVKTVSWVSVANDPRAPWNGFHQEPIETETKVPKIRAANYKGKPAKNKTYNAKNSGGGGSSKSEKTETWENPYDELYNLTEKINESLRTREALERRYEKLVKKTASTVGEVTKAYYDQIRQLRTEADLQYQMQAGRARQLNNVGNEYYMDSEGNRSTFSSLGVTKYASYDQKTGLLQIDWSGLEALEGDPNKVEEGKAAEAYISRLEELQDQFEEVRDKLWDIEDQIEQLREEAIENYLTFEDRVMDALVDSYQRQIDEYSTLSDQIKEQTDAIIKGIQDDVALSRQIRDNTKKEEDIADKEARLAYLRRDTSGANALEIKKLEDEIANARESYSDTMVDQQIQQLQDDANNAAEQRQHQIDIMQHQLDVAKENGTLWGEVWDLINTATAADGTFSQNTELVTLLEESEAYQSLSKIGQMKWWEEVAEAFKRAQVGLSEAEDKYGVDANGDGKVTSSGTSSAISSTAAMSSTPASAGSAATSTSSSSAVSTAGSGHFAKVGAYEHPMAQMPAKEVSELQQALNAAGFTDNDGKKLAVDGKYGSKTRAAVYKLQQKLGNVRVDGYYGPETRKATLQSQFKAYKTGGLADYTGPAWLDGSKTHPELVLNAKDTENFIELKNILAHSMGTQGAGGINNGDTYYEFNIDAEIGSDYDVEKLADKIKRLIYNDSSYRNINSINFTR